MTIQRSSLLLLALAASIAAADSARAQDAKEYRTLLRSPATVRGFIGGESHDSYLVHARKGQTMTAQISSRHEHDKEMGDNHAEFFVSGMPVFSGDGAIRGAKESNHGKRWSASVPGTGNYYIYVIGQPTVHYTLRVGTLPR